MCMRSRTIVVAALFSLLTNGGGAIRATRLFSRSPDHSAVLLRSLSPIRLCAFSTNDWRQAAYESIASREWPQVEAALAAAVAGEAALPGDASSAPSVPVPGPPIHASSNEGSRVTWKLQLAYYGPHFSGYAWQPSAPKATVEQCLQSAIRPLHDGQSELRLSCAGRTDAGVSALAQLVSFHSWSRLQERDLVDAIARVCAIAAPCMPHACRTHAALMPPAPLRGSCERAPPPHRRPAPPTALADTRALALLSGGTGAWRAAARECSARAYRLPRDVQHHMAALCLPAAASARADERGGGR